MDLCLDPLASRASIWTVLCEVTSTLAPVKDTAACCLHSNPPRLWEHCSLGRNGSKFFDWSLLTGGLKLGQKLHACPGPVQASGATPG